MFGRNLVLPLLVLVGCFLLWGSACTPGTQQKESSVESELTLKGPYLGQNPPGDTPAVFAPGIVNTGLYTRDVAMMPDLSELYFGAVVGQYSYSTMMVTKLEEDGWTEPEVAPFATDPKYMNFEPAIAPDGKRFFFMSDRPRFQGDEDRNQDIWVMDRIANGWNEPYNLGSPINSDDEEYFPSITSDGTIYFTRQSRADRSSAIYRSKLEQGVYAAPERLGPEVNAVRTQFNAFVAPDESYLITCLFGHKDSQGSTDYFVSFRDSLDQWTGPINMGEKVNTASGVEFSPYVSPDGKYFFFMSSRIDSTSPLFGKPLSADTMRRMHNEPGNGTPAIYWMDASFIEDLRPETE